MTTSLFFTIVYYATIITTIALFAIRALKGEPTKKLLINYFKILGICLVASLFPFLLLGLVFGLPSVLIASVSLTFFFREELA